MSVRECQKFLPLPSFNSTLGKVGQLSELDRKAGSAEAAWLRAASVVKPRGNDVAIFRASTCGKALATLGYDAEVLQAFTALVVKEKKSTRGPFSHDTFQQWRSFHIAEAMSPT